MSKFADALMVIWLGKASETAHKAIARLEDYMETCGDDDGEGGEIRQLREDIGAVCMSLETFRTEANQLIDSHYAGK